MEEELNPEDYPYAIIPYITNLIMVLTEYFAVQTVILQHLAEQLTQED